MLRGGAIVREKMRTHQEKIRKVIYGRSYLRLQHSSAKNKLVVCASSKRTRNIQLNIMTRRQGEGGDR